MRTRPLARLLPVVLGLALAGRSFAQAPSRRLDVPFVATPMEVVETMLQMAQVERADTLYDLGSGDGRLVVLAAKRYGARGVGVDLDPKRIAEARARAKEAGVTARTQFIEGDLFQVELRPATVLTMYLLPDINRRLQPRILAQLRPGSRVVSHNYDLGPWMPDAKQSLGDHHVVYLWVVPASVQGRWAWNLDLPSGPRRFIAELEQEYQVVKGLIASGDAEPAPFTSWMEGDRLTFTMIERRASGSVTMKYRGQVVDGRLTGTVTVADGSASLELPWEATVLR